LGPRIPAGPRAVSQVPGVRRGRDGWDLASLQGPRAVSQVPGVRRGRDGWDLASLQGPRAVYIIESFIMFADMYVCR